MENENVDSLVKTPGGAVENFLWHIKTVIFPAWELMQKNKPGLLRDLFSLVDPHTGMKVTRMELTIYFESDRITGIGLQQHDIPGPGPCSKTLADLLH